MADVGDKRPRFDSPTTPFRKVVLPAEETVKIPRPPKPGPSQPIQKPDQKPDQKPEQKPEQKSGEERQHPSAARPGPVARQVPPPVQPPPLQQSPVAGQVSPLSQPPSMPPPQIPVVPPKPPARGIGDIPIKVVYLLGAVLATVLAVVLVFVVFSGDVPTNKPGEEIVRVAPVPTVSATPTVSSSATVTESPIVLPPVPESKAFKTLSGTASAVIGTITDNNTGITYPRLAAPWKARSFPPYSVAQRIGKVKIPFTVIASAKFPADVPAEKPESNADYREIAISGVRWSMRTQYPKGATLKWTASQKLPVGKGWTLGYEVTYTVNGKKEVAQAMMTVIEVGRTKPTMLMASIPQSNKSRWRDINTLVQQVRPI